MKLLASGSTTDANPRARERKSRVGACRTVCMFRIQSYSKLLVEKTKFLVKPKERDDGCPSPNYEARNRARHWPQLTETLEPKLSVVQTPS